MFTLTEIVKTMLDMLQRNNRFQPPGPMIVFQVTKMKPITTNISHLNFTYVQRTIY